MEEFILIFNFYCVLGFGFNIWGGSDVNYFWGYLGIFVMLIKLGGFVDCDSWFKIGDRFFEVN